MKRNNCVLKKKLTQTNTNKMNVGILKVADLVGAENIHDDVFVNRQSIMEKAQSEKIRVKLDDDR